MSANATPNDAVTVVPGQSMSIPQTVFSIEGRNTSLPGYSEAGLVERAVDRYEVVKALGAGGMGEVALVQDHDIDRRVAVKFLHAELAQPALVARFLEEIRTVGQLEHPNIVPIHDAGRDEAGRYFFVMKHIDPAYLARYTFLERVEIFIAILNALKFAEAKGFIHRDLKPANVMVGRSGEVMLMDWGLAKSTAAGRPALPAALSLASSPASSDGEAPKASGARQVQTQAGSLMGTPQYMSPEQAAGRNDAVDNRSDLYSAAVLFHELMFLEHYLEGRDKLDDILAGVMTVPPRTAWTGYVRYPPAPPPYLHIIAKGMQKDPAKRFQSADELITRLRHVQDGTAPIQCVATATRRLATEYARLVDRSPGKAILLTAGGSALLIASTVGWLVRWLG
jgi:serine/threonine-protein kinase